MCLLLFSVVWASIIYISQVGGFLGFVVGVWLFYGLQVFGVLLLVLIWLWCDTLVWVWGTGLLVCGVGVIYVSRCWWIS